MRAAQLTLLADLLEEARDYVRAENPSWASRLDGALGGGPGTANTPLVPSPPGRLREAIR